MDFKEFRAELNLGKLAGFSIPDAAFSITDITEMFALVEENFVLKPHYSATLAYFDDLCTAFYDNKPIFNAIQRRTKFKSYSAVGKVVAEVVGMKDDDVGRYCAIFKGNLTACQLWRDAYYELTPEDALDLANAVLK